MPSSVIWLAHFLFQTLLLVELTPLLVGCVLLDSKDVGGCRVDVTAQLSSRPSVSDGGRGDVVGGTGFTAIVMMRRVIGSLRGGAGPTSFWQLTR